MKSLKKSSGMPHRGAGDDKAKFIKKYVQGRLDGFSKDRRTTWKVHANSENPSIVIEAKAGVLKRDPPWECPYSHCVHVRLGRLWRDIRDSAKLYAMDVKKNKTLRDNFFRCMERLYPR